MSYSTILNTSTSLSASQIDDPQTLNGLFPPDSDDDDDDNDDDEGDHDAKERNDPNCYEIQSINFVGKTILVRQYDYHSHNANRIWPGAFPLAEYLLQEHSLTTTSSLTSSMSETNSRKYVHQWGRILELGAATGLLAMRLAMASTEMYQSDDSDNCDNDPTSVYDKCCCTSIVTSDVNDEYGDISANLLYNYNLNHMTSPLPYHIPHTWGTGFQQSIQNVIHKEMTDTITTDPKTTVTNDVTDLDTPMTPKPIMIDSNHPLLVPFDTIIASDILLYVSSYPALVATLSELMIPAPLTIPPLSQEVPLSDDKAGDDPKNNDTSLQSPLAAPTTATTNTTTTVPMKFIMSWNRRLKESQEFFIRMNHAGFTYEHHGKGVYIFEYNHHHHHQQQQQLHRI